MTRHSQHRADDLRTFNPATIVHWRPAAFDVDASALPIIGAREARPIVPELDLWDCWPLEHPDGRTVVRDGCQWWFFLSAPRLADPGERHDQARIRLITRDVHGWHDQGPAMPDGFTPGSREWAGSAILWEDGASVSLLFTAAGRRGERHSFEQRLFECRGRLSDGRIGAWARPTELVASDGARYVAAQELTGLPGAIKAFRDPSFFRDPETGSEHILFSGSAGWYDDPHNGVVGMATRKETGWGLDDPLFEAIGVNNELERPHVRVFNGLYYLFFSTQTRTFAPIAVQGPNGLYGFVSTSLFGAWTPVNQSGLIAANPKAEPTQAYSWWVEGDGTVASFIDHWGIVGRDVAAQPALTRQQFGGTPAPAFGLEFSGDQVTLRR